MSVPVILRLRSVPDAALRAALLAGGWMLLNPGDAASWLVGAPVVLAALAASLGLTPRVTWRSRVAGACRFAGFFMWQSLAGGVDVAWRALHPGRRLRPGFVALRLRLPPGAPRVCLANVISLLPGSLAAGLEGDRLTVHAVDATRDITGDTRRAEARVAELFGLALPPAAEEEGGA